MSIKLIEKNSAGVSFKVLAIPSIPSYSSSWKLFLLFWAHGKTSLLGLTVLRACIVHLAIYSEFLCDTVITV